MSTMPPSEYLESRNGNHYLAGTRISLATIVYAHRRGETPTELLEDFPSFGSIERAQGLIAFVEANPEPIQEYLQQLDELGEKFRREHPIPQHMLDRLKRIKEERARRSA